MRQINIRLVYKLMSFLNFELLSSAIMKKILKKRIKVICVSYCSAANTIQRCNIDPTLVFVIPNAISDSFNPELVSKTETSLALPSRKNRINVSELFADPLGEIFLGGSVLSSRISSRD